MHPGTHLQTVQRKVRSFKSGLKKALLDPRNSKASTETVISRYLFAYRNTPHCYTGDSPAKLMFGRKLRTCFDLLKENSVIEKNKERQIRNFKGKRNDGFAPGELVWALDYRNLNERKWVKAEIVDCLGERHYVCKLCNEEIYWRRHLDQLRKASNFDKYGESEEGVPDQTIIINKEHPSAPIIPFLQDVPSLPEVLVYRNENNNIDTEENFQKENLIEKEHLDKRASSRGSEDIIIKDFNPVKVELNKKTEPIVYNHMEKPTIKEKAPNINVNVNEHPKRTIKKPDRLNL
ncbi:hypothetical protein TKK_0004339 [Trichogramma kaykai]|uniref:Uncharacterized protein n=1 Tax=Trichogramma kaykai TaxID=54128 RepID=A0ABD2XMP0_9HYME